MHCFVFHLPLFLTNIILTTTNDARIVQQDRWLLCYEFVYNSGVFPPVLWSVILHLWALLIPFLSCVSFLIFDPNLKPPHRMGQHGWRRVVFLTFRFNAYIYQRQGPPVFGVSLVWTSRYLLPYISIYLCFYCPGPDLNPTYFKVSCSYNPRVSGVKEMERQRKYKLDSEMENTFLFEMIIPPDG